MADLAVLAVTIDCRDVSLVAVFWSELLGLPLRSPMPGWARVGPLPNGLLLTFQPVLHVGSGGVHVDLGTSDGAVALARVLSLGGRLLEQHSYDEGVVRVVADPEGHVFCVVQYAEGAGPS